MELEDLDGPLGPYRDNPEVLGIVVVGSASRHYRDALSDYDVEIITTDRMFASATPEEQFFRISNDAVECALVPESDFSAKKRSIADIDHWPYTSCIVLHDPDGYVINEIEQIAAMPEELRQARIRLHYFEFLFSARKIKRTMQRGDELNVRLLAAQAVMTVLKLLFVLQGQWPPITHWTAQNLAQLEDIPATVKPLMIRLLAQPNPATAEQLIQTIDGLLSAIDFPYVHARTALENEVGGPMFRQIREQYGVM
jgi:hypothetical protein